MDIVGFSCAPGDVCVGHGPDANAQGRWALDHNAWLRPSGGLTRRIRCSTFVLMEVETLGVARSLGWKVHMRCADGYRQEDQVL